jgi:hypothetical protein
MLLSQVCLSDTIALVSDFGPSCERGSVGLVHAALVSAISHARSPERRERRFTKADSRHGNFDIRALRIEGVRHDQIFRLDTQVRAEQAGYATGRPY